jgi:hypothetical protein
LILYADIACGDVRSDFLSGDNYQELQKFGSNIKEKQKENSKKKAKTRYLIFKEFGRTIKEKQIVKKESRNKKYKSAIGGILKFINTTEQWTNKKLNDTIDRLHHWKKQVRSKSSEIQLTQTKQSPRYKLVEIRKQRGNKTIVIRKRIPIKYDNGEIKQHQKIVQQTLFDLQFEFGGNCIYETRAIPDRQLKSSIWDMPVESEEKTEKWKTFFDFWNDR